MSMHLQGHPGEDFAIITRRSFACPRCQATKGDDWMCWMTDRAVPLADGTTIVCWNHATEAERRNRWCASCQQVKDQDDFDLIDPEATGWRRRWKRNCRACLEARHVRAEVVCARCDSSFIPKRKDAVYCSGRCRVAAHRAKSV